MTNKESCQRRDFLKMIVGVLSVGLGSGRVYAASGQTKKEEIWPKRLRPELHRLLQEMEAQSYRYWSIPRKDGQFLNFFIRAMKAKQVLEIGTSQGYSAIWMGLALKETRGHLTTIEIEKSRYELAQKYIKQAALSPWITPILGDAHQEIIRLAGPFDFVFLDADKEGQVDYFQKLYPRKILPGGVIAVHNAIRYASSMQDYLDLVRHHPHFDSITISATMDDGFCLSYRSPD